MFDPSNSPLMEQYSLVVEHYFSKVARKHYRDTYDVFLSNNGQKEIQRRELPSQNCIEDSPFLVFHMIREINKNPAILLNSKKNWKNWFEPETTVQKIKNELKTSPSFRYTQEELIYPEQRPKKKPAQIIIPSKEDIENTVNLFTSMNKADWNLPEQKPQRLIKDRNQETVNHLPNGLSGELKKEAPDLVIRMEVEIEEEAYQEAHSDTSMNGPQMRFDEEGDDDICQECDFVYSTNPVCINSDEEGTEGKHKEYINKILDSCNCLNDLVINEYLKKKHCQNKKVTILSTHFVNELQLLRKRRISPKDITLNKWILVPDQSGIDVFTPSNPIILPFFYAKLWSLVVIVDLLEAPQVYWLDSYSDHIPQNCKDMLLSFVEGSKSECQEFQDFESEEQITKVNVPKHQNPIDCGLFVLEMIDRFCTKAQSKGFDPTTFLEQDLSSWFQPKLISESKRAQIRNLFLCSSSNFIKNPTL
jgi:hypothetical protein